MEKISLRRPKHSMTEVIEPEEEEGHYTVYSGRYAPYIYQTTRRHTPEVSSR